MYWIASFLNPISFCVSEKYCILKKYQTFDLHFHKYLNNRSHFSLFSWTYAAFMWCRKVGFSKLGRCSSDFVVFMCFWGCKVGTTWTLQRWASSTESISFVHCLGDGLAETSVPVEIHVAVQVCGEQSEVLYQWFYHRIVAAPVQTLKPLKYSWKIALPDLLSEIVLKNNVSN